jgi:hypothetical protein
VSRGMLFVDGENFTIRLYVAKGEVDYFRGAGSRLKWCRGAELNCLRRPFQGRALPVSYPGTGRIQKL